MARQHQNVQVSEERRKMEEDNKRKRREGEQETLAAVLGTRGDYR